MTTFFHRTKNSEFSVKDLNPIKVSDKQFYFLKFVFILDGYLNCFINVYKNPISNLPIFWSILGIFVKVSQIFSKILYFKYKYFSFVNNQCDIYHNNRTNITDELTNSINSNSINNNLLKTSDSILLIKDNSQTLVNVDELSYKSFDCNLSEKDSLTNKNLLSINKIRKYNQEKCFEEKKKVRIETLDFLKC